MLHHRAGPARAHSPRCCALGLALLTHHVHSTNDRAKAFGIYGAIAGAGGAIGLLLGGALTEYLSWRWTL